MRSTNIKWAHTLFVLTRARVSEQLSFGKRPLWGRRIERVAWQLWRVLVWGLTALAISFGIGFGVVYGVGSAVLRIQPKFENPQARVGRKEQSVQEAGLLPGYTNQPTEAKGRSR